MSYENAKANLQEFGKQLNLEGLDFDENNTCILGIDNAFSLHLTYEPHSDRLYLYSPLLDGLPEDKDIRLKLFERLLEGSMLGGQMAGGGVGVAVAEGLILIHCVIEMGPGTEANALARFAPLFVETVEKWREIVTKICAGEEPPPFTLSITAQGGPGAPQNIPNQPGGFVQPSGGEGFIKA